MSAKHYEMVAKVLKSFTNRALTHREHTLMASLAGQLGSAFHRDNPNFDNHRFVAACDLKVKPGD